MARTLPWLAKTGTTNPTSRGATVLQKRHRSPPSKARDALPDANDFGISNRQHARKATPNGEDPPSSPVNAQPPPQVEYMNEGFDADDRYRMVEDELYATASIFTRHIHEREYEQHKRRVRAKEAGLSNDQQRATAGGTTLTRKAVSEKEARARTKNASKAALSLVATESETESEGDAAIDTERDFDDPFAGFAALSKQPIVNLNTAVLYKPNTLAAAGLKQRKVQPARTSELLADLAETSEDATLDPLKTTMLAPKPVRMQPSGSTDWSDMAQSLEQDRKTTVSSSSWTVAESEDRTTARDFIARRKAALEEKQKQTARDRSFDFRTNI